MKYLEDPVIQWGLAFIYAGLILIFTKSYIFTALMLAGTAVALFALAIYNNWDKIKAEYEKEFKDEQR